MKTIIVSLILLGFAGRVFAQDRAELNERLQLLTAKFDALEHSPDKSIPATLLAQAKGVVLLDGTKAGFIFAYQGGNGVALVKNSSGDWSPTAFLTASEASLGFQVGGEQNFYVILLMTTNAAQALTESTINFAGEAQGTAGDQSAGVEGKINVPEHSVIVYSDRQGLFGGAAIKGGALAPDDNANEIYYGRFITMDGILFEGKASPSPDAVALAQRISYYSKPRQ